jgi:hypothetical protein
MQFSPTSFTSPFLGRNIHISTQFSGTLSIIIQHDTFKNGFCRSHGGEYGENYVRFEVFTAVTMKNADFWDMKTKFVPHRRHIPSPLQSSAG